MFRNWEEFEEWANHELASKAKSHMEALELLDHLLDQAKAAGLWPRPNPFEGMEVKLRVQLTLTVFDAMGKELPASFHLNEKRIMIDLLSENQGDLDLAETKLRENPELDRAYLREWLEDLDRKTEGNFASKLKMIEERIR